MKKLLFPLLGLFVVISLHAQPENGEKKDNGSKDKSKTKAYSEVITDEAISDEGLFTVHQVGDKHYFEIPFDLLEEEILVVSRIAGHVKGLNFGGAGMKSRPQQVIRWQRKDNKVLLRSVSYNSVASEEDPVYRSVRNNNVEPIVMAFDIATFNEDSTNLVIEISDLFTSDVAMIGPLSDSQRKNFKIKGLDKKRSLINSMKAFPENVEVRHLLTFRGDEVPGNALTGTLSLEMNQSFIVLPKDPWQPRMYDDRVGYFSVRQTNYSLDEQKAAERRFITRWRLDPKDPAAYARGELVEPKEPIVYYVDPATPEKWRPYIMQGVEDWQQAFEKAGFKNAILAKEPPSKEEDPDWSPEDVRYSVIRYITTDIQNAQGPHVHDPRTGEILESDILWYHNVMNLLRNWFFIQTAAVNPDARKVKFDDELMGELIRFVAAHEVGHTLGLPHNMGSSVAYPIDSLRSPGFVQRMGVAPSIMDYARFNYVAQPEDEGAGLMPRIGPYDEWSIMYGYKLNPDAETPEADHAILNEWIKERADDPVYRYGRQQRGVVDPTAQTEDVGHDAMLASELGLANLKRIVPKLIEWTSEEGKDYDQLEELYNNVIGQFRRYTGHVSNQVGGVYGKMRTADEEGVVYTPIAKAQQERAVAFLNQHVFATPDWLIDADILARIEASGISERIGRVQSGALNVLFRPDRLNRLIEQEAVHGAEEAYTIGELFQQTREGIFGDMTGETDAFRRNLQRAYLKQMKDLMQVEESTYDLSDMKAMARGTLLRLQEQIESALEDDPDEMVALHLKDLEARIEHILEMKPSKA